VETVSIDTCEGILGRLAGALSLFEQDSL